MDTGIQKESKESSKKDEYPLNPFFKSICKLFDNGDYLGSMEATVNVVKIASRFPKEIDFVANVEARINLVLLSKKLNWEFCLNKFKYDACEFICTLSKRFKLEKKSDGICSVMLKALHYVLLANEQKKLFIFDDFFKLEKVTPSAEVVAETIGKYYKLTKDKQPPFTVDVEKVDHKLCMVCSVPTTKQCTRCKCATFCGLKCLSDGWKWHKFQHIMIDYLKDKCPCEKVKNKTTDELFYLYYNTAQVSTKMSFNEFLGYCVNIASKFTPVKVESGTFQ